MVGLGLFSDWACSFDLHRTKVPFYLLAFSLGTSASTEWNDCSLRRDHSAGDSGLRWRFLSLVITVVGTVFHLCILAGKDELPKPLLPVDSDCLVAPLVAVGKERFVRRFAKSVGF